MMDIEDINKADDNRVHFLIQQEFPIFSDITIGTSVDSYGNLTLKPLGILEWSVTNCSQANYILKTDDDIKIFILKVLNFIQFEVIWQRQGQQFNNQ